jgi:hypothetical protein
VEAAFGLDDGGEEVDVDVVLGTGVGEELRDGCGCWRWGWCGCCGWRSRRVWVGSRGWAVVQS